jgi:hypothetical protein
MNLWGTFTTVVLVFVIYCFLSAIYHFMIRYARINGYGIFTEGFTGYKGILGRGAVLDKTHNAYSLGQLSPLVTNCNCSNGGCAAAPGNHYCRCGNNCLK